MTTPPPLPPNQPTPPVFSSQPPPIPPARKSRKVFVSSVILAIAACLIVVIALAATCPDEHQLRQAVYGEMDGRYKLALETVGRLSRLAGGPGLIYHNHIVYSTLDFQMLDGSEVRFASGVMGKARLTSQVQDVKELILSVPGAENLLNKGHSP